MAKLVNARHVNAMVSLYMSLLGRAMLPILARLCSASLYSARLC